MVTLTSSSPQAAAAAQIGMARGSAASAGSQHAASFSTELLHLEGCLLTALMDVQLRVQGGETTGVAGTCLALRVQGSWARGKTHWTWFGPSIT